MKRITVFFGLILWALAGLGLARAEQASHLSQAREHANTAVAQGQKGDARALAQHAETALEHVKLAYVEKPLPDLKKAIQSLEKSIQQGKDGQTEQATEHAREAIEYLDATKGALGG